MKKSIVSLLFALLPWVAGADLVPDKPATVALAQGGPDAAELAIRNARLMEPLRPLSRQTSPQEDMDLAQALRRHEAHWEDLSPLEEFVQSHPNSAWNATLLTNLGLYQFRAGYLSRALNSWEGAWASGKGETALPAKAIVDRALGELCALHARIGHASRLEQIFDEIKDRPIVGQATELVSGARQGLGMMQHRPEVAFRCGPLAVNRILRSIDPALQNPPAICAAASTTDGTSLSYVASLANQTGFPSKMAFRSPGAAIVTPAVMHWKVGHFAALLRKEGDKYLVEDPTFKTRLWISPEVIDAEASGYFVVGNGPLPARWRAVDETEGGTVWGRGQVNSSDPLATRPSDLQVKNSAGGCNGMAVYNFHGLLASLHIEDVPLSYSPPVGPPLEVRISYNQREATQPAGAFWHPSSPKWNISLMSWLLDDTSQPSGDLMVSISGGGGEIYTGFSSTITLSQPNRESLATLERGSGVYYRHLPDGGLETYTQLATSGTQRFFFLTRKADRYGNGINVTYGSYSYHDWGIGLRIEQATDDFGDSLSFVYDDAVVQGPRNVYNDPVGDPGNIYTISLTRANATDGITRYTYLRLGGSATDTVGMGWSVTYAPGTDFVNSLTTPYGTTTFSTSDIGFARSVSATDPLGATEYLEYRDGELNQGAPGIVHDDPVVPDPAKINIRNETAYNPQTGQPYPRGQTLQFRNSFYWDKKAYAEAPGDYNQAHIYHWLHNSDLTSAVGHLESEKSPLENRVWYNYQGQADIPGRPGSGPTVDDGTTMISKIAQVVDQVDENGNVTPVTQLWSFVYNTLGYVTQMTDPLGRTYTYTYTGSDLTSVTNTTTGEQLLTLSSYANHHPQSVTDAAGQVTGLAWTTRGQLLSIHNAKGEDTVFNYNSTTAFLQSITVNGQTVSTFVPDGFQRVQSVTDSTGYTITYAYDNLDRITSVGYPDGTSESTTWHFLDPEIQKDRFGRVTQLIHDKERRPTLLVDPLNRITQFGWCDCGSLESIKDPVGNYTYFDYDIQGRLKSKTFANGQATTWTYETGSSRVARRQDALGQITSYRYYLDDALQSIWYDGVQQPTADVAFTYETGTARVHTITDGSGTTTFTYNPITTTPTLGAGLLASIDGPLAGNVDLIQFAYDQLGRQKTVTLNGVSQQFSFDAFNRLTQEINALGTFDYTFQANTGLPDIVKYNSVALWNYDYSTNATGRRLQQLLNTVPNAGAAIASKYNFTFDALSNLTTLQSQVGSATATTLNCQYDNGNQLLTADLTNNVGTLLKQYAYRYDAGWNRTQEQIGTNLATFDYSNPNSIGGTGGGMLRVWGTLNEPGTVTVNGSAATVDAQNRFQGSFLASPGSNTVSIQAKDGNGNTSTKNYSVNVGSAAAQTWSFDSNGQLAGISNGGAGRTLAWDAENRLVSIVDGSHTTLLEYDSSNRLVHLTEKDSGVTTSEKRFIWLGYNRLAECDGTGAITRRFFSQGEQIGSENLLYAIDHLGSIRDLISPAGAIRAHYDYDPYGRETAVGPMVQDSNTAAGQHQHQFDSATTTLPIATGDKLVAYVWLDPAAPPTEIMLQWSVSGNWEHRAYWGANQIALGTDGTVSRRSMGALPATGGWTRLEVPAANVGLEGTTLTGMAFTLYDGHARWDHAAKQSSAGLETVWVEDALPAGAITSGTNGDGWTWLRAGVEAERGFTGLYAHRQSGYSLASFRAYSPNLGRWLSRDPLGESGGLNLFAYVANNPTSDTDPLGLACGDEVSRIPQTASSGSRGGGGGGGGGRVAAAAGDGGGGGRGSDDLAILKSIRRYAERLVQGKVTSPNPGTMARVREIQEAIRRKSYWRAGTEFHELNFDMARDAQARGFLPSLNVNMRLDTPLGVRPYRIPDYRFGPGETFDIKVFRPSAGAYDATNQFQDINGATGIMPVPLYYRLW